MIKTIISSNKIWIRYQKSRGHNRQPTYHLSILRHLVVNGKSNNHSLQMAINMINQDRNNRPQQKRKNKQETLTLHSNSPKQK